MMLKIIHLAGLWSLSFAATPKPILSIENSIISNLIGDEHVPKIHHQSHGERHSLHVTPLPHLVPFPSHGIPNFSSTPFPPNVNSPSLRGFEGHSHISSTPFPIHINSPRKTLEDSLLRLSSTLSPINSNPPKRSQNSLVRLSSTLSPIHINSPRRSHGDSMIRISSTPSPLLHIFSKSRGNGRDDSILLHGMNHSPFPYNLGISSTPFPQPTNPIENTQFSDYGFKGALLPSYYRNRQLNVFDKHFRYQAPRLHPITELGQLHKTNNREYHSYRTNYDNSGTEKNNQAQNFNSQILDHVLDYQSGTIYPVSYSGDRSIFIRRHPQSTSLLEEDVPHSIKNRIYLRLKRSCLGGSCGGHGSDGFIPPPTQGNTCLGGSCGGHGSDGFIPPPTQGNTCLGGSCGGHGSDGFIPPPTQGNTCLGGSCGGHGSDGFIPPPTQGNTCLGGSCGGHGSDGFIPPPHRGSNGCLGGSCGGHGSSSNHRSRNPHPSKIN